MISKTIEISLIHTGNSSIHKGKITLNGSYPKCSIQFTSSVSQNIEAKGHDYFQCLINLRIELEKKNYYLLCNGARRDLNCGGGIRRASCGCLGYIIKLGKYLDMVDIVNIFDYAKPDLVASVSEQKQYYDFYKSSLPQLISYSVDSIDGTEIFSTITRKKIIERLCYHSDWQLLEEKRFYDKLSNREGSKLWLNYSNNPEIDRWNIDMKITNYSIYIQFTLENDLQREAFLIFLNEQLRLNNVVHQLKKL